SYNPWISLYWLVTGKTVGGTVLYGEENRLNRQEALKLYTLGSAHFSREVECKGSLSKGKYADIAVLSEDYFAVPDEAIKNISSVLTLLGGKCVYSAEEFKQVFPLEELPVSPDWSPVRHYGGYHMPPKIACRHVSSINPWTFGCGCFW